MATYAEVVDLYQQKTHKFRIAVAVAEIAGEINTELDTIPNHTERYRWAAKALSDPVLESERFLLGVLVEAGIVDSRTVVQINDATDAQIKTYVNALVDVFALFDFVV